MGKAEILGLETKETKETKEDKIMTLDELIDSTKEAHLIELELSKEATRLAMGESSDEYIYNIPRETKDYGKEDCGIMCDKMPRGYCKYRAEKQKHIHTLGVNINGALVIMNAYMGLDIEPSDPEIKEFTMLENGKLITKAYWYVNVKGVNKKTEVKLSLPFMQPTMKKSGNYYTYDEYGSQIAVSKAVRNLILKIVPGNFQQNWIREYMENPAEKKNKPKDNPKDKPGTSTGKEDPLNPIENGNTELTIESAIEKINAIDALPHLSNWYNKHANWVNKLKSEDKHKVVDVFNKKKDQLSVPLKDSPPSNRNTELPELATTTQYEAIRDLAQELGYSPDQLDEICKTLVGNDDIPGMTTTQANIVLIELQKTKKNRQSSIE